MKLLLLIGTVSAMGCTVVGPSPETQPLTIRALEQGSEAPILGAQVLIDGRLVGQTGPSGEYAAQVPIREFCARVQAAGYQPSVEQCDRAYQDTRWTFYLWR